MYWGKEIEFFNFGKGTKDIAMNAIQEYRQVGPESLNTWSFLQFRPTNVSNHEIRPNDAKKCQEGNRGSLSEEYLLSRRLG